MPVWVKGMARGVLGHVTAREMLLLLNIAFTISGNACNAA